uniref:Uncharacterized protein n=1 Tax=Clytia hemisphaerica TaxID=252671 RepID=A0A7M5WZ65_9CNID
MKKIHFMTIAFLLASNLFIHQAQASKTSSPCRYKTALKNLIFFGQTSKPTRDAENAKQCVASCNKIKTPKYKSAVIYAHQCFCSKARHIFNSASFTCKIKTCDWLRSTCSINQYLVFPLSRGIREINVADNQQPLFVGEDSRLPRVKITGDKKEAKYRWSTSNKPLRKFNSNPSAIIRFKTPGYKLMTIQAKNPFTNAIEKKIWLDVGAETETVDINCPPLALFADVVCHVIIPRGTHVSLKVEVKHGGDKGEKELYELASADAFTMLTGTLSRPNSGSLSSSTLDEGVHLNQEYMFNHEGVLHSIEIFVERPGVVKFWIVEPACGDTLCVRDIDLTKPFNANDAQNDFTKWRIDHFNVKYTIMTKLPAGRHQILVAKDIHVKRGYFLTFVNSRTQSSGQIYLKKTKTQTLHWSAKNFKSDLTNSQEIGLFPSIQTVSIQPIFLPIGIRPTSYENIIIDVTAKSTKSGAEKKKVLLIEGGDEIQEKIEGLKFVDAFKKIYSTDERNFTIKVNITKGTNVVYMFDVPALRKSSESTNGEELFDISLLDVGKYDIWVTAANKVSFQKIKTTFEIVDKIDKHQIKFERKDVYKSEEFTLDVNVQNGTDVLLEVAFGDGERNVQHIKDARSKNGVLHKVTHSYSQCGRFTITAKVRNLLTQGEWEETYSTIAVDVICRVDKKAVIIEPFPIRLENEKHFEVALERPFLVNIHARIGSYLTFLIHWGDGSESIVDQSERIISKRFKTKKRYTAVGLYNVTLTIRDLKGAVNLSIGTVNVTQCGAPLLIFNYGLKEDPELFPVSNDKIMTGVWFVGDNCTQRVNPYFSVKRWSVKYRNGTFIKDIVPAVKRNDKTTKVLIKKGSLEIGEYTIELEMSWNGEKKYTETYYGYIDIVRSFLEVQIVNGIEASIPPQTLIKGNISYFSFKLDGSISFDPDNKRSKLVGMTFEWTCRSVCSQEQLEDALHHRKNHTDVIPKEYESEDSLICLSQEWKKIGVNKPELDIHTAELLEGFKYDFKLVVTKGERVGRTTQRLNVLFGATPLVKITCANNCGLKINTMDRFILHSECENCDVDTKLDASWTVIDDEGNFLDDPKLFSTGLTHRNLVVKKHQLKQNTTYNFTLTIGYFNQPEKATFVMTRKTSVTPTPGNCSISPTEAPANARFRLWCEDWFNIDQPTFYEFRYQRTLNRLGNLPIINPTSTSENEISNVLLPVGLKERDYRIDLVIMVRNKYGQFSEFNNGLSVKVTPIQMNNSVSLSSIASSLIPHDTNDVAAVTSAAQAIGDLFQMSRDDENNKEQEYDDVTGMPKKEGRESKERKAKYNEERKEIKKQMMGLLSQVPLNNAMALGAVAGALRSMTNDAEDLNDESQERGIEMVSKLTSQFDNFQQDNDGEHNLLGYDEVENSMNSVFGSVSNLFTNEVKNVELGSDSVLLMTTTTTTTMSPIQAAKTRANNSINNIDRLVNTLDQGFTMLAGNKVEGESPTTGKMGSFEFGVQKATPSEIANLTVAGSGEGAGGFALPQGSSMFNQSTMEDSLSVLNVNYDNNIYVSDTTGAKNIKSKVASLSFKAGQNEVKVNNTESPIVIKLENKVSSMKKTQISLPMPGFLKIHKVKLKSTDCQLLLSLNPEVANVNEGTRLVVYVQYGKPPTTHDHDFAFELRNKEPIKLIQNSTLNKTEERVSNVELMNDGTLFLWSFDDLKYGNFTNKTILFLAFRYEGLMPDLLKFDNPYTYDVLEMRGSMNYSLITFCAECSYWNKEDSKWKSDGCQMNRHETSLHVTTCHCNHLTSFGSFFVAPNPLPTPSLALLKEGYVLFVTVGSVLFLYVIGMLIARRADKADQTKIGVCPIPDNKPEHHYLYEITINTGSRLNAGTKSKVYINVIGDLGESGVRPLYDSERSPFQRSSSDVFIMATESSLGELRAIRVFHDNSGGGWYLRNVEIVDLVIEKKSVFLASRWLAVELEDGRVDRVFRQSSQAQLKEFNYLFVNKAKRDLSDAHLWFSIYARPPRSSFSRCQRLSVAMSILFTHMLANLMFYGRQPAGSPATENKVGSFSINMQQIFIAVISACICIPVNILLVTLFRNIKPPSLQQPSPYIDDQDKNKTETKNNGHKYKMVSSYDDHGHGDDDDVFRVSLIMDNDDDDIDVENEKTPLKPNVENEDFEAEAEEEGSCFKKILKKKEKKKKEPTYLPEWVLYPAWVLNILVILGCGFMVVWYGMAFGNKRSLEWLTSVTIGLVQDILLVQPLKVLVIAVFVALVVRKLDDEEKSEVEKQARLLARDEEWLHPASSNADLTAIGVQCQACAPSDRELAYARDERIKEIKMKAITRELGFYVFFCFVVYVLGMSTRDTTAFHQTINMRETLQLHPRETSKAFSDRTKYQFPKVTTQSQAWDYLEVVLLPNMFPDEFYQNISSRWDNKSDIKHFPNKLTMSDLTSKVVTGTRLRQVRIKKDTCTKPHQVAPFITIDCAGPYNRGVENKGNYDENWANPIMEHDYEMDQLSMPWRWQDSKLLDAFPIIGNIDTYFGNGYVTELFPRWNNKHFMEKLKEKLWLDRHTRALIVETVTYNPATNYFQNVAIVFEFAPTGGVVHYNSVITFKLYRYTSKYSTMILFCEITFILCMLLFLVREARRCYRNGAKQYFTQFWNLIELLIIIVSILAICFYFYRDKIAKDLFKRLPSKAPQNFISFQFAAYWDQTYSGMVALISFFVTLKFIKLLRFNRRIAMLSSTLKRAWDPLSNFGIIFGIIITACVVFGNMVFGRELYDYQNYFRSTASIIGLLLGKFSYHEFTSADRLLGPIFFFAFNFIVNWVVMNMFIAILNEIIMEVHANEDLQSNEYEMVDYFLHKMRGFFGWTKQEAPAPKRRRSSRPKFKRLSYTEMDYSFLESSAFFTKDVDEIVHDGEYDMSKDQMQEVLDKFIGCVNMLYFDDVTVAKRMNGVVKKEIEKKMHGA